MTFGLGTRSPPGYLPYNEQLSYSSSPNPHGTAPSVRENLLCSRGPPVGRLGRICASCRRNAHPGRGYAGRSSLKTATIPSCAQESDSTEAGISLKQMGQRKDAGRKTSGRAQRCSRSVSSVVRSGLALICRPTIDTHVIHPHGRHFHCRPSSLVLFCQPVCMCKWSPTPCQEDPRLLVFVRSEQSLALLGRRTSSSVRRRSYVVYEGGRIHIFNEASSRLYKCETRVYAASRFRHGRRWAQP
jgi:hypothetical protein